MSNKPEYLTENLTRGFRYLLVALGLMVVGIGYMEWRFDDRLRYRAPDVLKMSDQDGASYQPVLVSGQRWAVYVPAYSHVYHQDGRPLLLTVTLSVRNADRNHEIDLTSVRYYDSDGQEIRSHVDSPIRLKPLSTVEFLVNRDDTAGGSGASFIVEWTADHTVTAPVIETVMIDTERQQGISFARPGHAISKERNKDEVLPR